MPYIEISRRKEIDNGDPPKKSGELNYVITKLMISLNDAESQDINLAREELRQSVISATRVYVQTKGLSYQSINDVNGAISCAAMEFARRVGDYPEWLADALVDAATEFYVQIAAPYEDSKIRANGDVYV